VCVALAGYLAAQAATPTGHGLRLAAHLLVEHHEAAEAVAFGPDEAHAHGEADHRAETHRLKARHLPPSRRAPGHEEDHHGEAPDSAAEGVHAHHGRLHAHREAPTPLALLTLALDKHCVFSPGRLPAPTPARALAAADPGAIHAPVVLLVEVRPPQRTA
jgi:hypothetical protein